MTASEHEKEQQTLLAMDSSCFVQNQLQRTVLKKKIKAINLDFDESPDLYIP